jgi:hypothetical protein
MVPHREDANLPVLRGLRVPGHSTSLIVIKVAMVRYLQGSMTRSYNE